MSSLGLFQTPSLFGPLVNSVANSINSLSVIPAHTDNPQPVGYSAGFTGYSTQPEGSFWDQWLQSTVLNTETTSSLTQPYQGPITSSQQYFGNDWVNTTLINSNFAYSLAAEPAGFSWSETVQPLQVKEGALPAPASQKPKAKAEPAKADNKPAEANPKPSQTDNLLDQYEKAAGKFNSGNIVSKGSLSEQELKDAQNQATKTGKSNDTLNFMVNNFSRYAGNDQKIDAGEMITVLAQFKKEKGEPTYNFVA